MMMTTETESPARSALIGSVRPAAWIDRSGHPHHLSYMQGARERQLYGPLQPLYAMPADLAEYVLSHLISERASLDGFLALGNERPRAKRLDKWIDALMPNVEFRGVPAGRLSNTDTGGTSTETQG